MPDYSKILEVYSMEEILEWNDVAAEDALRFLIEEEFLDIPTPRPLDFDD